MRTMILFMATWALVFGLVAPALADMGDIIVGGIWAFTLKNGASGRTLEQRTVEVERRITEVLSVPKYRSAGVSLSVRPVGASAAIAVGDVTIVTVTPEDATVTGVKVTPLELARQWAQRLAAGLNKALPDARFNVF